MEISIQFDTNIYHGIMMCMINIYYIYFCIFKKDGADIESFHRRNVNRGILGLLIFSYLLADQDQPSLDFLFKFK